MTVTVIRPNCNVDIIRRRFVTSLGFHANIFIRVILSKNLDTSIYDFIQGINFFTYERQLMTKFQRAGRSNTRELSGRSFVDITTAVDIAFLNSPNLTAYYWFFFSFSKIFNLCEKIASTISLPSKNPLIKFKILHSSGRFEKLYRISDIAW